MAEKRNIEKQLLLTGIFKILLLADSSITSITYKSAMLLIKRRCQNQFFMKQMFVLKEINIGEKFELPDLDTQEDRKFILCFV